MGYDLRMGGQIRGFSLDTNPAISDLTRACRPSYNTRSSCQCELCKLQVLLVATANLYA